ncbi:MAG: hypothetical protein Q7T82_06495 [Armatimonadota bacterium]|nr:hypothetical protein [Armatimonadota bacterium]
MSFTRMALLPALAAVVFASLPRAARCDEPTDPPKSRYAIRAPGITLKLTERGAIRGVVLANGKVKSNLIGGARLLGCGESKAVAVRKLPNGGIEFTRTITRDIPKGQCLLTERFTPAKTSIRWELRIRGKGPPWTAPIITQLDWPVTNRALFWTAWDDPTLSDFGWRDPLTAMPFARRSMWIGAPPIGPDPQTACNYTGGDAVSIPIASILIPSCDAGLSLVLSPEDVYLDTAFNTGAEGRIVFARINHRISSARPVKFSADIVAHEADWRAALGWMVSRYPRYFNPPNPRADEVAGCAAYSACEGDLDVAKLRKMAFRVNWKASYDFPYCGMFIPPVKNDYEKWPRFDADSSGTATGARTETSIAQLSAYSRRLRETGFHVLSFFNVTEMGLELKGTAAPDLKPDDPELWRNPRQFVFSRLGDAIVENEAGRQCASWGDQIVMDAGVASYRDLLLDQAKRHITKLPASSGICIDRMDWLRACNAKADDAVSWRGGKPVRALTESWKSLMSRLGPLMHAQGKVVFANALLKRIDLMREIDGVYHEYGHLGTCLNGTAFLCVRKPALAWTPCVGSETDLTPDADSYFQRHLYMGVYPTAPFPGNDHAILPSEWADKWYLDYGPLLNLMRGKKWVLEPHAIEVEGNAAKANLFQVFGGYVAPITFGGKARRVYVIIRKPSALATWPKRTVVQAIHPGSNRPVAVSAAVKGNLLRLTVPLRRGCAMVYISLKPSARKWE